MFSNRGIIGIFDLNTEKEDFFNELDTNISTETGLNIEDIKKRRSNQGDYLKYNLEFLEKYLIEYFNGFALQNKIFKYGISEGEGDEGKSETKIQTLGQGGIRRAFFKV